MVTPAAERKAVAHLIGDHGMSERRACKAIGTCRMTIRYRTTRQDDTVLRQRMKAIALERRRFGIGGFTCCSNGKVSWLTINGCFGSTVKNA